MMRFIQILLFSSPALIYLIESVQSLISKFMIQSDVINVIYFEYYANRYEYRWADGVQIKKPIEVSAPKYVEYLMEWVESQLDDESIFPQKIGNPF